MKWKKFLPCHLEYRHGFSTNFQIIVHSAFLSCETWITFFLLPPGCGHISEGCRPANHHEPGTEQNHPRSVPGWECFLFEVIIERTGWANDQLPVDWTNLILWRKPGRSKSLKSCWGHWGWDVTREQNKGLWLAKLIKCQWNTNLFLLGVLFCFS